YALAPVFPLGCNDSINAARAKDQRAPENVRGLSSVNVRAVTNAPFTIERQTTSGGRRVKLDSSNAVYKGDGTYVFAGVPAGLYAVKLTPGKYRELWDTKSVPSQGMTSVQANQEARALMMLRPVQGVGEYTIRAERQVYLYHLETDTDSFTTTFQEFGATFETVTTFVYLIGAGPRKETWGGPAWNGFVSMSPKPFDRYRVPKTDGTTVNQQQSLFLGWDGKDTSGKFTFTGLPTGLHSSPRQQTNPVPAPDDFWGSIGSRAQNCAPARVPGGQCGDFAWIDHRAGSTFGAPASEIVFHSNDGECYLESNVPGYKLERSIQLGGEHARRCSRDFMYYNPRTKKTTRIKNFLPRKDGTGGGRMILSVSATTSCIADCGLIPPPPATATMGYQDPGPDSVRPATDPPPSTPVEKPKVTIVREKPTGGTQSYSSSAAPAAPLSGTTSNNTLASALTGKK
ncbi:MAG: hypothetical protein JWM86_2001, partial [Thermoleophilia bacterium]|nr:hypothetical protein [Thermoleophilia bacterium]